MAETSDDEHARLRSYMVAQAAKLSMPAIVAKLRADAESLYAALAAVPADRWFQRSTPDSWSPAELAGHALEVSQRDAASVNALLNGEQAPPFILDVVGAEVQNVPANPDDFRYAFGAQRETFFSTVLAARGDEHLDIKLDHPWFGPLNWREWLLFMRVHDVDHARYVQDLRFGSAV